MKSSLMILALVLTLTPAAPAISSEDEVTPRIEVCFVLDTTGSMSGLIEGAKRKIWSIANEIVATEPTPEVRFGLIGYRDRGDTYVTRSADLTWDLDAIYGELQEYEAAGGGDTPESVNQALHEAVTGMSWSESRRVLKIIFLVGDAPPHMDYDETRYPEICRRAVDRDLIINTVQCGAVSGTRPIWEEIASRAQGRFVAIAQSGGMVAITTPVDGELAAVQRELGETAIPYGDSRMRSQMEHSIVVVAEAPVVDLADKATFAARGGADGRVFTGGGDLLDRLEEPGFDLDDIEDDKLPEGLRGMTQEQRVAHIARQQERRAELKARIQELVAERDAHVAQEKKRLAKEGKRDAFDEMVNDMIREQAAARGLVPDAAPAFGEPATP